MTNPTAQKNPWDWGEPYPAWSEGGGFEAGGTGGGGGGAGTTSTVSGPYMAYGLDFWCNTDDCKAGFDIGEGNP